ncbi:hypothetical protein GTZ99_01910 [Novosphingobium sp. FSY-8]|uniref:Methyltransferase n=1 Tax=Novosphingobium ovatum TaxID=1908523 RepID=A0ABW9X9Y7_9SPHN|nr:CmcJ/NvfI family oxidoreductase [Novosphingobium ovatum]NBC35310.1 hypothetical protein [Novosphingobium ovatum]
MATMAPEAVVYDSIEETARQTPALIRYLAPGDFVTRRYVRAGAEINTGEYRDYDCVIRDGMPFRDHFQFDTHGFVLGKGATAVQDFWNNEEVAAIYDAEAAQIIKRLTGADRVAPQGWMRRTSADLSARAAEQTQGYQHSGGIQPPAGEAHVDYNTKTAHKAAARMHEQHFGTPDGYGRFICVSLWRTFSPGPQDWPLAVCDGRSVGDDEGKSNTLFVVDQFPQGEALTAPVPGEDDMIAAYIFNHRPEHRWWYFSNMVQDDVLLFKFHDSDHSKTWRCPHTAFHDNSLPGAQTRSSIELRAVAFFD